MDANFHGLSLQFLYEKRQGEQKKLLKKLMYHTASYVCKNLLDVYKKKKSKKQRSLPLNYAYSVNTKKRTLSNVSLAKLLPQSIM